MKKTLKFLIGIFAITSFAFYSPAAYADTTNDYNNKVAQAQAKIDDLQNQKDFLRKILY